MISFIGAGPGAADLLTLRGAKLLAEADVVIWAASLVSKDVLDHCKPSAEIHDSKSMTLEEITAVFEAHPDAAIARLHSGDPSVYGAISEQIGWCVDHDRCYEIVPGVSSLGAAAAAVGRELTVPGVSQSVVMTRLAHRTKASMPASEGVAQFARHGATMAVFLSAARPEELQEELLGIESRYSPDTPAVIAWKVSWPDERLVHTTVGGLAEEIRSLGARATVLVLIGQVLGDPDEGRPQGARHAHVYAAGYAHSFRGAEGG